MLTALQHQFLISMPMEICKLEIIEAGEIFDWSRRSQQFGIGGRFLFARISYNLK